MRIFIIITTLLFAIPSYGQSIQRSVIASGGESASSGPVSANITMGEPAITSLTGNSHFLSQGFLQTAILGEGTTDPPTSVPEGATSHKNELKLYPNPVSSYIYTTRTIKDAQVAISSLEGKTFISKTYESLQEIDVSDIPAGVYVITVRTREETMVNKFVKE